MTKAQHTPGPWFAEGYANTVIRSSDRDIASMNMLFVKRGESLVKWEDQKANARLIAAAPELYALLSEINTVFYASGKAKDMQAVMSKTKPLLMKARGE